jgi:hypothetical protein
MLRTCEPFARKTRQHAIALQNEPPCAKELYDWLLCQAPAGKPTEIFLEAFQADQSGRLNGKGYQLRWIKDCLKKLVDLGLVDVVLKFSSKVFKLITWHPQQRNAENQHGNAENLQANARSQPSTPYPVYPSYRESRETTDNPTHHPVNPDEQERTIDSPNNPPEPEIEPTIVEHLQTAGFQLNSTLKAIVRSTQAQIVLQAIEAAQQYLTKLQQKNQPLRRQPEALLVAAIREEWRPQCGESGMNSIPPEFDEWLKAAQIAKLVSNSSVQTDVTGHPPGVLCILTVSGDWTPYEEMRRLHSLAEVKDLAERQQKATVFTPSPRLEKLIEVENAMGPTTKGRSDTIAPGRCPRM